MRAALLLLLVIDYVNRAASLAARIDVACSRMSAAKTSHQQLTELVATYKGLRSFGAAELPLPPSTAMSSSALAEVTGLGVEAFVPRDYYSRERVPAAEAQSDWASAGPTAAYSASVTEPSAVAIEGAVAALLGIALLEVAAAGLNESGDAALRVLVLARDSSFLAWLPVTLGLCGGAALAMTLVDGLLRSEVTRSLLSVRSALVPSQRERIVRHEAGHFLTCVLLGMPVAAVDIDGWAFELRGEQAPGVSFHSPALVDAPSRAEFPCNPPDVDKCSVVLMAGIAAEALYCGAAEGGAADQSALAELLAEHPSHAHTSAKQQARWAAANAVLLLQAHPEPFEAVCGALRERASIGECCSALEAAFARSQDRLDIGLDTDP